MTNPRGRVSAAAAAEAWGGQPPNTGFRNRNDKPPRPRQRRCGCGGLGGGAPPCGPSGFCGGGRCCSPTGRWMYVCSSSHSFCLGGFRPPIMCVPCAAWADHRLMCMPLRNQAWTSKQFRRDTSAQ